MRSKRLLALFLSALLVMSALPVLAFADEDTSGPDAAETEVTPGADGSFSILDFNIAGLPSFSDSKAKKAKQKLLGQSVAADGYDIVCVQECFDYDDDFSGGLNYAYRTSSPKSCVFGDGLAVFSKTQIYNVSHYKWNKVGGQMWEGDSMSQKGVMKSVVEIASGVYINVYVLHADAYGGRSSQEARADNFRQTAELINADTSGRATIVVGDFNSAFHFSNDVENMYTQLLEPCGLKDAWVELENGGSYTDFSAYSGDYWGNWDSVEHVLYKDGDNVTLNPVEHEYIVYVDDNGKAISDHSAEKAVFEYTVASVETNAALTKAPKTSYVNVFKAISIIAKDLSYAFSHWDEVKVLIQYLKDGDIQYLYDNYSV
ncbi:MAG: endonuclease/exonuclease/phosphatase family protein [Clostridia bacterium]|nr:endonuclease/exonuclease/phosphatase family protein [Clostridia bacterium]